MMDIRRVSLCLFVILILCSCTEQKKRRKQHAQRKFKELCRQRRRSNLPGTALELQTYFDLRPGRKPFASLKISTCNGTRPVCFVTTDSTYLKSKSINDTSTWQELITFIQRDREIEPIYDTSVNGWNGDKYNVISHYFKNQPTIYRMCRNANVYRFVVTENLTNITNITNITNTSANITGNSSSSQQNMSSALPVTTNTATTLCPLLKQKTGLARTQKGKARQTKRVDRSQNKTSNNFFLCEGLNCPCVRICLGQGRNKQRFSDCSKFRIICTFTCASDTIVPVNPSNTRPTRRPTRRPRKHGRSRRRPKKKSKTKNRANRNKKTRIPGNTT